MKPTVSVVIVNHDTPAMTEKALLGLRETVKTAALQLIVVDNSARDCLDGGKADVFICTENLGFANACNIGARRSAGEYLLFLNSDAIVQPGTVDACLAYLQGQKDVGVLGVRMLLPNGAQDKGCKRGFPTPVASLCYFLKLDRLFPKNRHIGRYHMTYLPDEGVWDVEAVSGAFMLLPNAAYQKIGEWDERFFMYGEDLDYCLRAKEAGFRVVYYGDATIRHEHGASSAGVNKKRISDSFYESMRLFYDKHYKGRYSPLTTWLVYRGIELKRGRGRI